MTNIPTIIIIFFITTIVIIFFITIIVIIFSITTIVGNKGKWQLYKASCLNRRHIAVIIRQVAVTCRRGTSVVRNLKFLTPSFVFLLRINIILSMNRSYVISPYNINTD